MQKMIKQMQLNARITRWFQALTPKQRAWLPYVALVAAVFATYANVYQNAFVLDDWGLIVYNDSLRHWSSLPDLLHKLTIGSFYRPVQVLLYFFVFQAFGLSLAAFHALNVLLQAANACLMYRLGCRLGFFQRASFAAALLWGVHPLWIQAVTMMAGTADSLVGFFCMSGLLVLLPDFKPRRFWLASLMFVLALGSKESAIVFPALAVFTLLLVSRERLKPATYIRTWPLWLLVIPYIIGLFICPALNSLASYAHMDMSYVDAYRDNFVNRTLTSLATLPVYLALIIWPTHLHIGLDFPIIKTLWDWQVIGGIVIVAAALIQIIRGRGKNGLPLSWGLLWFAAALSPHTGILKAIDGQLSEHWIYLPTIGLFLGVSQTLVTWMDSLRSKKVPVLGAGLLVLAMLTMGVKTYLRSEIVHDAGSLYEHIIKYNPTVWARYNLGVYYFSQREYAKAGEQWQAAEADDYKDTLNKGGILFMHNSMAYIYLNALSDKDSVNMQDIIHALPSSTHIPEAIEELKASEAIDPHYCCASLFLSGIYYYLGDKEHGDYYKDLTEKNAPTNELKNSLERPQ